MCSRVAVSLYRGDTDGPRLCRGLNSVGLDMGGGQVPVQGSPWSLLTLSSALSLPVLFLSQGLLSS